MKNVLRKYQEHPISDLPETTLDVKDPSILPEKCTHTHTKQTHHNNTNTFHT